MTKDIRHLAAVVCACIALSGCPPKEQPAEKALGKNSPANAAPIVLISAEERQRLERELMNEVAANKRKKCERTPLRGAPSPGPADADIVALVRPKSGTPLHGCLQLLAKHKAALDGPSAPAGLLDGCAAAPAAIRRAAQHGDACSPYLAGRRGLDKLVGFLRLGKALPFLIARLADQGKAREASRLGLDMLRVTQDIQRGEGAPLIAGMIGTVSAKHVVERGLRPLLDRKDALDAAQLDELEAELARLESTEPPFNHLLRYELSGFALQYMLPSIKGKGWIPPGGYDEDLDPAKRGKRRTTPGRSLEGVTEQDQHYIGWIAGLDNAKRMVAACPADAKPEGCAEGLVRAAEKAAKEAQQSKLKRLVKLGLSPTPNQQLKDWIVDILKSIAAPAFTKYVARYAGRAFQLRALRIHARLAKRAAAGKCPADRKQLIDTALQPDPACGRPLRIEATKDAFVLRPAKPRPALAKYDELSYEMKCPR